MREIIRRPYNPFGDLRGLSNDELRQFISWLEKVALENGEPLDIPIKHHFSNKVYGREMKMPRGALVIGKIHAHENLNILSQGEVSVLSQDGVFRVKAPYTFVGTPGAKRVIYAHTPVTWTTIHGTESRDLEKIEQEVIAPTYDDVRALENTFNYLEAK